VREQVAQMRRQKAQLSRTSFFDDVGEGISSLFSGGMPSTREVELNTTTNMLGEAEAKLAELEKQREANVAATKAAQNLDNAAKSLQDAAASLGGGGKPNRSNSPSPVKS